MWCVVYYGMLFGVFVLNGMMNFCKYFELLMLGVWYVGNMKCYGCLVGEMEV